MPVEADVRPSGPFSLRLSARRSVDGRSFRDGLFSALLAGEGYPVHFGWLNAL